MKTNKKLLLILLITGGIIAVYGLNSRNYTSSQIELFLKINGSLDTLPYFWLNVTALGDALVLFPLISFFIVTNTQVWASLFGSIPLALTLSSTGKDYFSIPRPAAVIDTDQFTIIGNALKGDSSLPSGHTITIFAVISAIILTLNYTRGGKYRLNRNLLPSLVL